MGVPWCGSCCPSDEAFPPRPPGPRALPGTVGNSHSGIQVMHTDPKPQYLEFGIIAFATSTLFIIILLSLFQYILGSRAYLWLCNFMPPSL